MTYAWTIPLIERLAHRGVREAVLCPGSRSTPLSLAAEHHPDIRTHVQIDERAAGYFALGLARASGRPVVIITTSGTAVANLLPACIEAHQANIPLLLLTADRPDELRGTGANQTMHQVGLFDAYTRYAIDAPHPGDGDVATIVDAAIEAMTSWPPGPAHINQPLREPLSPAPEDQEALAKLEGQPGRGAVPPLTATPGGTLPDVEPRMLGPRGLIVCGPGSGDLAVPLGRAAAALGAVVIKDALSGVRFGAPHGISGYDAYIDHPDVTRLRPDWILQLGTSPTSKALRSYLAAQTAPRWKVDASGRGWNDIPGDVTILTCDAKRLLEQWERPAPEAPAAIDPTWADTWHALDAAAAANHKEMVEEEPDVEAAWVAAVVTSTDRLFVGNSMPVRDLDRFARRGTPIEVFSNRGVSGIDGTIATAAGIAQTGPLMAVIGDVAFQHDVGSLALMPPTLRLIVIDNAGGRIFHHLPVSQATPHFERLFLTKPAVDIAAACTAFGRTCTTTTPSGLAAALASKAQVIIVRTDGQRSAHTRQQMRLRLHRDIPAVLAQHS